MFMNSSWVVCKTVCESKSGTDFDKHCSWTVYEHFAKQLAKANQSPTLANIIIHEHFMNSLRNILRKLVSHRLWQACSSTVCKTCLPNQEKNREKFGNQNILFHIFQYGKLRSWEIKMTLRKSNFSSHIFRTQNRTWRDNIYFVRYSTVQVLYRYSISPVLNGTGTVMYRTAVWPAYDESETRHCENRTCARWNLYC